jgi:hypothetical protein
MNTQELLQACMGLPLDISILVDGNHGIGKSQVVTKEYAKAYQSQVAKEYEAQGKSFNPEDDFGVVDMRLSQNDVGDLKGIPMQAGGFTFFAPPHWFPVHEDDGAMLKTRLEDAGHTYAPFNRAKHGILFLDELNRATREVLQAAFELVLDRRLNGWKIPDGWRVMAAINGDSDLYQIMEMDPALTDRFFMVKFVPQFEEWFAWGKRTHKDQVGREVLNLHPAVLGYVQKKIDAIDPSPEEIEKATLEGSKIQSRRSWARLSNSIYKFEMDAKEGLTGSTDILDLTAKGSEKLLVRIAEGFLGSVWALDFTQYVKSDYRILSAKEVVDNYNDTVSAHVSAGGAAEMNEFVKTLVSHLARIPKKLSEKRKENLLRFVQDSKNETAANFWATWSGDSKLKDQADDWFENPKVKLRMLECFGNPNKTKARREALAKQIED